MHSYYGANEYSLLQLPLKAVSLTRGLVLHVQDAGSVIGCRHDADRECMQVKSGGHVVLFSTSDANPDPWVGPQRQSKADLEALFSACTMHPASCLPHLTLGLVHKNHSVAVICGDVAEDRVSQTKMLLHASVICTCHTHQASHVQALKLQEKAGWKLEEVKPDTYSTPAMGSGAMHIWRAIIKKL